MKRPAAVAGIAFLITLFIMNSINNANLALFLMIPITGILLALIFLRKLFNISTYLTICISSIVALALFFISFTFFYSSNLMLSNHTLKFSGELVEAPEATDNTNIYMIKPIKVTDNGKEIKVFGKIKAYSNVKLELTAFDKFDGEIAVSDLNDPLLQSFIIRDRSEGIYLNGYLKVAKNITKPTGIKTPYYYAIKIREFFGSACQKYIGGQNGEITKGIVIGDTSSVSDTISNSFRATGLTHIMAVSGMNLAFIIGFILVLFDLLSVRRRITYFVCILSAIMLTAVAGFSPSVVRALIMVIILYGGMMIFKEGDALNSLGLSVFLICLVNPFSAINVSLLLSFAATLGIILLSKPLTLRIKTFFKIKKLNFFSATIIEAFSSSVSAIIFTLPISAYYFNYVSTIAIVSNILAVFAVSINFICGILTALFSFSGVLAMIPAFICKLTSVYLMKLSAFLASFNLSTIYANKLYIYIFCGIIILYIILRFLNKISDKVKGFTVLVVSLAFLFTCATVDLLTYKDLLRVKVIDVGQGDSIAIIKDNKAVLVDGGGDANASQQIVKTINESGFVRLEAIIVTHYHADHTSALKSLLSKFKTKMLILPPSYIDDKEKDKLIKAANGVNTQIVYADEDKTLSVFSDTKIEVLTKHIDKEIADEDLNNVSMAVKVDTSNTDYLLMGDLDSSVWKLVKCYGDFLRSDVIKVGHHGSNNSITNDLLRVAKPKTAIISVGNANKYFLPTSDTLDILNSNLIPIYRTDLNGTVTSFFDGKQQITTTERKAS